MAILALASDLADLRKRLGAITVAYNRSGEPVTAEQIRCAGSMAVLLKDALKPNLVQTLEGQPAFVHCGPFANIAHGNSSLVADRVALKIADYVITESGLRRGHGDGEVHGHRLPAGRTSAPSAVVLVATIKALKLHGGRHRHLERGRARPRRARGREPGRATSRSCAASACRASSRSTASRPTRTRRSSSSAGSRSTTEPSAAEINTAVTDGGDGAADLARAVVAAANSPSTFTFTYPDEMSLKEKIEAIAMKVYGASGVDFLPEAQAKLKRFTEAGLGELPICMAKTHLSISHDPALKGAPRGFTVPVRDLRAYTGAGFVTALCGTIVQMPGLGKTPAGFNIDIDASGRTVGLF